MSTTLTLTQIANKLLDPNHKFTREEIDYRDAEETCQVCEYFQAGMNTCDLIEEVVAPGGSCKAHSILPGAREVIDGIESQLTENDYNNATGNEIIAQADPGDSDEVLEETAQGQEAAQAAAELASMMPTGDDDLMEDEDTLEEIVPDASASNVLGPKGEGVEEEMEEYEDDIDGQDEEEEGRVRAIGEVPGY